MDRKAAQVFAAALALPKDERLGLAEELLASVDETTPEWAAAWRAELTQRDAAPESECEPWESVHNELKAYTERS